MMNKECASGVFVKINEDANKLLNILSYLYRYIHFSHNLETQRKSWASHWKLLHCDGIQLEDRFFWHELNTPWYSMTQWDVIFTTTWAEIQDVPVAFIWNKRERKSTVWLWDMKVSPVSIMKQDRTETQCCHGWQRLLWNILLLNASTDQSESIFFNVRWNISIYLAILPVHGYSCTLLFAFSVAYPCCENRSARHLCFLRKEL